MSVAVIIPFYNAKKYLDRSIGSCRAQGEASQIILVDDGSTDDGLAIAEAHDRDDNRILLLQHKENRGRSAARNTGMRKVASEYTSFLDADDYFFKNRFSEVLDLLATDHTIGGIYEPVGTEYSEPELEKDLYPEYTGISKDLDAEALFEHLILGEEGHISLIGCTFRTNSIMPFSFDENLSIGEDTDFLWRITRVLKIIKGGNQIRVVRSVHGANSLFNPKDVLRSRAILYKKWLQEIGQPRMTHGAARKILKSYAYYSALEKNEKASGFGLQWSKFKFLFKAISRRPSLIRRVL